MGDNVVLRFQFKGKDSDAVVADIDKVNLIDLVTEYWESAEKHENPVAFKPEFTYLHKMTHQPLSTDLQLMKMFKDLGCRKLIHVWMRETDKMIPVVEAATNLRKVNDQAKPIESVDQSGVQSQISQIEKPSTPTPTNIDVNNPPLSPNEIVVDNMEFWDNIEIESVSPNRGRGRGNGRLRGNRRGKGAGRGNSPSNQVDGTALNDVQSQFVFMPTPGLTFEVGESSKQPENTPLRKKRIPKTTARRKALRVPSKQMAEKRKVAAVSLGEDGDLSEDDSTYMATSVEDNDSENTCTLVDSDEEDSEREDNDEELIPVIHDYFDDNDGPIWDDECEDFDNYMNKLYRNGELYKDEGFGKIVIKPWQLYTDKQHLKDVLRDYCIQSGFSIIVERSSRSKYTVRCSDENCSWRMHAGRLADEVTWAIKLINSSEHNCLSLETKNPMVNAKWAKRVLMEDIRANNDIPFKALNELLWERNRVEMAKITLYRAKKEALYEIHGGFDISYSYLPTYCDVIKEANPQSFSHCCWHPQNHPQRPLTFKSIFISFKVALDGLFAGCRGLIGVDGTFLKGNFGGCLLSAVAMDGNNEMFPFAWAIVSSEDDENWRYFVYHLKHALQESGRGNNWCIISDRHKSIDNAFTQLWPEVGRRYGAKHLSVNWKLVFSGPNMSQLFWLAAGAYSEYTFRKAMEQIQNHKPAARIWLSNLGEQKRWSKHKFDPNLKCGINKTNFVESFNATLGIDRCRPVLTLLEGIRRVTMVRLATRRQLCEKWERSDICPNIVKKVQQLCSDSRTCRAHLSGQGEYEIADGKAYLPVSLNNHTCKCNQWKLTGIPCKHGMRTILAVDLHPLSFVHECYSVKRYKMAYAGEIKAITDREQWPETNHPTIQPPTLKRGVRRPVKNRRRGQDEQRKGMRSKTLKCSICGNFGHNMKTCQVGETKKQQKSKKKGKDGASTSKKTTKKTTKSGKKQVPTPDV